MRCVEFECFWGMFGVIVILRELACRSSRQGMDELGQLPLRFIFVLVVEDFGYCFGGGGGYLKVFGLDDFAKGRGGA